VATAQSTRSAHWSSTTTAAPRATPAFCVPARASGVPQVANVGFSSNARVKLAQDDSSSSVNFASSSPPSGVARELTRRSTPQSAPATQTSAATGATSASHGALSAPGAAASSAPARTSASSATSALNSRKIARWSTPASPFRVPSASQAARNSSKEVGRRSAGSCEAFALMEHSKNTSAATSQGNISGKSASPYLTEHSAVLAAIKKPVPNLFVRPARFPRHGSP
jgi:hypothetical protein